MTLFFMDIIEHDVQYCFMDCYGLSVSVQISFLFLRLLLLIWTKSDTNTFIMQQDPEMIPLENIQKACAWRTMDTDAGKAYVIP